MLSEPLLSYGPLKTQPSQRWEFWPHGAFLTANDCSVKFSLSLSFGYLHWKCWKLGIFLCGLFCTKMIHSYYLIQANIQNISPSHCGSCPSIFSSMKIFHDVFFIHAITFFPHITTSVAFLEIDLVTTYFPDGGAW